VSDDELTVAAGVPTDAPGVIALIGRVFAEYGFVYEGSTEVPDLRDLNRTGERSLPEDVNDSREYGFERGG
jgi:hypothetical protein